MLIHWPAKPDTDYATLDDLYEVSDLTEMDIRVPAWRNRLLRLRALSLDDREFVNRYAGVDTATYDGRKFIVATLHKGIVRPAMTIDQAERLTAKSASVIDQLINLIWRTLSSISQAEIAKAVDDILGTATADAAAGVADDRDAASGLAADPQPALPAAERPAA